MASVCSAIRFPDDDMRMESRLAFAWHNVAGKREYFDLFSDRNLQVSLLLGTEKTQGHFAERADRRYMCISKAIGVCKFQKVRAYFIALVEYEYERLQSIFLL